MSKWKDLFEETPPADHLDKVMQKAEPYLIEAAAKNRRQFIVKWLVGGVATGIASFVGIAIYRQNQNENLQLAQFVDIDDQDLEFVADHDFEFDVLENLDLLEQEDV